MRIIREEVINAVNEYGMESIYYNSPGGFEQVGNKEKLRIQHFDDLERWKIVAMQLGATIQDRGDDFLAVMPNQDKLGTYVKMLNTGTLNLYN